VLEYARSAGICMSLVQNWSYICFNHRCPVDASAFGKAKAASHRSFQVELLGWLQDIDWSEYDKATRGMTTCQGSCAEAVAIHLAQSVAPGHLREPRRPGANAVQSRRESEALGPAGYPVILDSSSDVLGSGRGTRQLAAHRDAAGGAPR
jgi:hypothetical protein